MASQRDNQQLKKVGLEGFALIDECYGRNKRPSLNQPAPHQQLQVHHSHYQYSYNSHRQPSYVLQVPQVYTVTKEPPITQYYRGAMSQHQYYGGGGGRSITSMVEGTQVSVISSNEAARLYGGTMMVDYGKTKALRRPF